MYLQSYLIDLGAYVHQSKREGEEMEKVAGRRRQEDREGREAHGVDVKATGIKCVAPEMMNFHALRWIGHWDTKQDGKSYHS